MCASLRRSCRLLWKECPRLLLLQASLGFSIQSRYFNFFFVFREKRVLLLPLNRFLIKIRSSQVSGWRSWIVDVANFCSISGDNRNMGNKRTKKKWERKNRVMGKNVLIFSNKNVKNVSRARIYHFPWESQQKKCKRQIKVYKLSKIENEFLNSQ